MEKRNRRRLKLAENSKLVSPLMGLLSLISDVPPLASEEVDHLIKLARSRTLSAEERQKAQEKLVLSNIRLVISIAKQFSQTGVPIMDLISEGTIGLMSAIQKFEPKKGFQLSTYATWWIRQRMLRYILSNKYLIRVPEHIIDKLNRIRRFTDKFVDEYEREPSAMELEKMANLTMKKLEKYLDALPSIISLEEDRSRDPGSESVGLHERVGSEDDKVSRLLDNLTVRMMFDRLDDKEKAVMCMRYGLKLSRQGEIIATGETSTLDEAARGLELSRERVRQIEKSAIRKLRKFFLRKL